MSETKGKNILLVYKDQSSFVKHDIQLLSNHFEVKDYYIQASKKVFPFLWSHLKLGFYILTHKKDIDIIYTWFGDYHAFTAGLFARMLNKKHVIVIGGNDAVAIPQIGYGVFAKKNMRARLVKKAYIMATKLLVVDPSLIESENLYSGDNNIVGVENILPGLKIKCEVIPTGYNAEKWKCENRSKKQQILSVAIVESNKRAILKGFDLFVDLAKKLPQYEFVFIGLKKGSVDFYYDDIKNLTVFEKVSQEELKKYYCESKVYTQFSLSEGLPNSLCEAMLCECIPIGSSVSGIPNCIGDTGFILTKKGIDQAAELINLAMSTSEDLGLKARQRIIQLFPENQREEKLKLLMQSY